MPIHQFYAYLESIVEIEEWKAGSDPQADIRRQMQRMLRRKR